MVGLEQISLTTPHRCTIVIGGMVPTKDMQDSMHDEQGHLVVESSGMTRCLSFGDLGTDHHVAEQQR